VPVALAARTHHIPYVTHDSDALPGLSNRIAGRWARYHATALPAEYYPYPPDSIKVVGVPTDRRFRPYSPSEKRILKEKYDIPKDSQVLLVTGGSNGARRLNSAIIRLLPELLATHPNLYVLHQIGAGNDDQIRQLPEHLIKRVMFFDFSPEIFHMSAIADVIVARAGASAMADYASQAMACVVVPNPYLTGGHQLKNADVFENAQAAVVVREKEIINDPKPLQTAIISLLSNPAKRRELASNLHRLSPSDSAAASIADLIYEIAT
jgi:UDP-N-acetylglucosamine--N-acetylmuramyl-(pentapeptide) pyrophosphoryl-undecaprenol N-acetylglucosamine transferase